MALDFTTAFPENPNQADNNLLRVESASKKIDFHSYDSAAIKLAPNKPFLLHFQPSLRLYQLVLDLSYRILK